MNRKRARGRGLTLIELMVVVAVVAVLAVLAAPSLREMIVMQRLRGINAQLVTDLQFGRSEAVSRGMLVRFNFGSDANQTCYVIYTTDMGSRCDCTHGVGAACSAYPTSHSEIRTVSVPRSSGVVLDVPQLPTAQDTAFAFDHITGGLKSIPSDLSNAPLLRVQIDTRVDNDRQLRNELSQAGRPTVCAPNPSVMGVTGC